MDRRRGRKKTTERRGRKGNAGGKRFMSEKSDIQKEIEEYEERAEKCKANVILGETEDPSFIRNIIEKHKRENRIVGGKIGVSLVSHPSNLYEPYCPPYKRTFMDKIRDSKVIKFFHNIFHKKQVISDVAGLKHIDLGLINKKNVDQISSLANSMCRIDNLGMQTYILKNKKSGVTLIDKGSFNEMMAKYGDKYEVIESAIK
jgi:hypothetical protein